MFTLRMFHNYTANNVNCGAQNIFTPMNSLAVRHALIGEFPQYNEAKEKKACVKVLSAPIVR